MDEQDTQLDYEAEAQEGGGLAAAEKRIRKLKDELEKCKEERQEYLDGWQRLRADIANQKKEDQHIFSRASQAAVESLLEELLPVLDAFSMARAAPSWEAIDPAWKSGMEHVFGQLEAVFKDKGVVAYGVPGESFDPRLHEAVGEEEGNDESHTIVRVMRRGYMLNDRVLRPAQVVVAK